jgi:hypothetical protein
VSAKIAIWPANPPWCRLRRVYRAPTKILSLTLLACAPDFPPEIWSGEHLVYATDRDDLICEGSFHLQDRFVAALAELVGVRLDEPVLFVYVEQSRLGEFCVIEDASGCARHDAVISIWPVSHHELTHAVTRVAGWGGPASFVEGVAEAFNNGLDLAQEQAPLAEVLDGFQFSKPHYFTMGRFVRFLIERHELAAVGAFMRATKYDERRVDYEAAFAEHFGEPLSEAVLAFESYPACSEWNNRIALLECDSPLIEWQGDTLDLTVDVQCDAPEVFGPSGTSLQIGAFRAFDVAQEGTYDVAVESEEDVGVGVRITRCASCWDPLDHRIETNTQRSLLLPAGRYYATFVGTTEAPGELRLRVTPSEP